MGKKNNGGDPGCPIGSAIVLFSSFPALSHDNGGIYPKARQEGGAEEREPEKEQK